MPYTARASSSFYSVRTQCRIFWNQLRRLRQRRKRDVRKAYCTAHSYRGSCTDRYFILIRRVWNSSRSRRGVEYIWYNIVLSLKLRCLIRDRCPVDSKKKTTERPLINDIHNNFGPRILSSVIKYDSIIMISVQCSSYNGKYGHRAESLSYNPKSYSYH